MKKLGYTLLALVIIFIFMLVYGSLADPTPRDAISFVERAVSKQMKDPDSAQFNNVNFYPDSSEKAGSISGTVCGYVNGKNSFGAYAGNVRFVSHVTVTDNGRQANMSQPFVENSDTSTLMDSLWEQQCK